MTQSEIKKYNDFKAKHPDAILLWRCGDFYVSYFDDANKVAEVCGITLIRRKCENEDRNYNQAGFPHHALDTYLPKIIRAGFRVALCDQLEQPQKLLKRGCTELTTNNN